MSYLLHQLILDKQFHIANLLIEHKCLLEDPLANSCIATGDREIIDFVLLRARPGFSNFCTHMLVQEERKDALDHLCCAKGYYSLWEQCFCDACEQGNQTMMTFILPHITTRDPLLCRFAKDLQTFQWMSANGFLPWSEELLCEFICKKSNVEIVEYMLSNGCPCDKEQLGFYCCTHQNRQMKAVINDFLLLNKSMML